MSATNVILSKADSANSKAAREAPALGALAVLYKPTAGQLRNLIDLRARCAVLLAVDNSPAANTSTVVLLGDHGIDYVFNGNRGGPGRDDRGRGLSAGFAARWHSSETARAGG